MRLHLRAALGTALFLAVMVAPPAMADVFNGRIGFTSFRVDHGVPRTGDLFSMRADGTDVRQLTNDPADDAQTDWAPDGSAIAYRIRKPGFTVNFEVARIPNTGAGPGEVNRRRLTDSPAGIASSQPSWFPDMSAILYRVSGTGIDTDLHRIGPFGGIPALMFAIPGDQLYPSLSPQMDRIAFTLAPIGSPGDRGIVTTKPDGTDLKVLFDTPAVFDSAPAWSPDGMKIAFESDVDGDREVYVMNRDGSNLTQLTTNTIHDEGPAWSPDGTMLAYTSGPNDLTTDVHLMTASGVHLAQLTDSAFRDESPDWQAIPAPDTDRRCGNVDGAEDVRATNVHCRKALRLAAEWLACGRIKKFEPEVVDYGGTARVVLTHRKGRTLIAFLTTP